MLPHPKAVVLQSQARNHGKLTAIKQQARLLAQAQARLPLPTARGLHPQKRKHQPETPPEHQPRNRLNHGGGGPETPPKHQPNNQPKSQLNHSGGGRRPKDCRKDNRRRRRSTEGTHPLNDELMKEEFEWEVQRAASNESTECVRGCIRLDCLCTCE